MATDARKNRLEFGDFQTPISLARQVVASLIQQGVNPRSVLEPTCGQGAFLLAALEQFPELETAIGLDINPDYLAAAHQGSSGDTRLALHQEDCFAADWPAWIQKLPQPLLILGNPPWVTSSRLGVLGSANAPQRDSSAVKAGLDALTGKSNFDVSEWLLKRWIDAMQHPPHAHLAMLVKTSVARRILLQLPGTFGASLQPIDAKKHFGADVSACLLHVHADAPKVVSFRGLLVSNAEQFSRRRNLASDTPTPWRSGVKHDAAKVFELTPQQNGEFRNGLGECFPLEATYLYPLLKSTELAQQQTPTPHRAILCPQQAPGQPTEAIAHTAPQTWAYLCRHAELLEARRSSIYKRAPRFAIFGIGPYSFTPWKVAASCLHKQLRFHALGPHEGRPVLLDDTCALLGFDTEAEALQAASLLNSKTACEFLQSLIFWDAKRPLTIEILRTLSLTALRDNKE